MAQLRSVTCHIRSHCNCLSPYTGKRAPPQLQPDRTVLDLFTPQKWKTKVCVCVVLYGDGLLSAESHPSKY